MKVEALPTSRKVVTGIHVDGDWLRMVQARRRAGGIMVTKVTQRCLSREYGIHEFFSENRVSTEDFTISFPRHLATVRFLALPSTKQEEIKQMVGFEAERLVAFPLQELFIDSQMITTLDNGYSQVMAVIVEKAVIDKYLLLFREFEPESISLSSVALYNWFMNSRKDTETKTRAIINVGFDSIDVIIVEGEWLTFTRGVPLNQEGWAEKAIAETKRSLDAYGQTENRKAPEVIILSGAREELAEVASLMEERFSIHVEIADAFDGVNVTSPELKAQSIDYPGTSFLIPVGLLLQRKGDPQVNLLPDYISERRQTKQKLRRYITTCALSVVLILLSAAVILHALRKRSIYLQFLMTENGVMQPLVSQIDNKRKHLGIIIQQLNPGSECLQVLSELQKIAPGDIFLRNLVLEAGNALTLRGEARELSNVFALNSSLEKSPVFENVKVKYATKRVVKGKEITDFEINCLLGG